MVRLPVCSLKWPEQERTIFLFCRNLAQGFHQKDETSFSGFVALGERARHHGDHSVGAGWGLCRRSQGRLQWKQWWLFSMLLFFSSNKVQVLEPWKFANVSYLQDGVSEAPSTLLVSASAQALEWQNLNVKDTTLPLCNLDSSLVKQIQVELC